MDNKTILNNTDNSKSFQTADELKNLGRYTNLIQIGEGGISRVYKAYDPKLKRYVALKVLKRGIASSEKVIKRFQQEISIQSKLNISGCVKIYDCGEENGLTYCVLEFIDGKSLEHLIKIKAFNFEHKIQVILQISRIIKDIHSAGMEHRDIKPGNIIVDKHLKVFLLDFGLAKAVKDKNNIYQTVYGEFFGTPAYMSPESTDTKVHLPSGYCTDIYALGITVYELLTEHLPYDIEYLEPKEIAYIVRNEPPISPTKFNNKIPESLEKLLLKSLDKNPNYRPNADLFFKTVSDIKPVTPILIPIIKGRTLKKIIYITLGTAAAILIFTVATITVNHFLYNSKTQTKKVVNDSNFTISNLNIKMVKIPRGSFFMHSDNNKTTFITKDFYISSHEITNEQFNKVPVNNNINKRLNPKLPATNVSWHDAVKFCRLLTAKAKEAEQLPEGMEYRLPTEAEWDYACSGGSKDVYFYGNMKERLPLYAVHGTGKLAEVGTKKPNKFGLYDTLGNAWEWCYDSEGKRSILSIFNPVTTGDAHDNKVIRGGGANSSAEKCITAAKKTVSPHTRNNHIGFRIVLGYKIN
jgi:serine/threonine protein kinase